MLDMGYEDEQDSQAQLEGACVCISKPNYSSNYLCLWP